MKTFFVSLKILIVSSILIIFANGQWVPQTGNLPTWISVLKIDASNSNVAVVALSPQMVYRTVNGGQSWTKIGSYTCNDVSMIDSSRIWIGTIEGDIYSTTNGGNQWIRQFHDSTKTTFINYLEMFNRNEGVAMADGLTGTLPAVILKTTDGGSHWTSVNDSAFGGYSGDLWRRIQFVTPFIGYLWPYGKGTSSLWKTTDGGKTWNNLNLTGNLQVLRFYNESIGIACFSNLPGGTGLSFRRTIDGGVSWETIVPTFSGFWGNDIEFVPGSVSKIWFTDNKKLFYSADTGRTWNEQYTLKGRDIVFLDSKNGWAVGDDNILIKTQNGGVIANARMDEKSSSPHAFVLYQNVPNPFNPSTTIAFNLPSASYTRIVIFNSLGQLVEVLVNRQMPSGLHTVVWNPSVSSGIYFYRFEASSADRSNASVVQMKKMQLIK